MKNVRFDPVVARDLGLDRISVSLAALLIAWEFGEWNGQEIPEADFRPYLRTEGTGDTDEDIAEPYRIHTWHGIEPIGLLKVSRDYLLSMLLASISEGRLEPVSERRGFDGRLDPTATFIHIQDVPSWSETHGIELGDWYSTYVQGEEKIAAAAVTAAQVLRQKMGNRDIEHVHEDFLPQVENYLLGLVTENKELRQKRPVDPPLQMKERKTLLAIVGLLAKQAGYKLDMPRKAAEQIADLAAAEGFRTLSAGAISKHLKAAAEAMDERKK